MTRKNKSAFGHVTIQTAARKVSGHWGLFKNLTRLELLPYLTISHVNPCEPPSAQHHIYYLLTFIPMRQIAAGWEGWAGGPLCSCSAVAQLPVIA